MIGFLRIAARAAVVFGAVFSVAFTGGLESASAQSLKNFLPVGGRYYWTGKVQCGGADRDAFLYVYSNKARGKLYATFTFSSGPEDFWDLLNGYESWSPLPNRYDLEDTNVRDETKAVLRSYSHVRSSIVTPAPFTMTPLGSAGYMRVAFPIEGCPIDVVMTGAYDAIQAAGGKKASEWIGAPASTEKRGRTFLEFMGFGGAAVLRGAGYDFTGYRFDTVEAAKLTVVPYGVLEGYAFIARPPGSNGLAGLAAMSIQQPNTPNCQFGGSCPYDLYMAYNNPRGRIDYCQFAVANGAWRCFESGEPWVDFSTVPRGALVNRMYSSLWDLYRKAEATDKASRSSN